MYANSANHRKLQSVRCASDDDFLRPHVHPQFRRQPTTGVVMFQLRTGRKKGQATKTTRQWQQWEYIISQVIEMAAGGKSRDENGPRFFRVLFPLLHCLEAEPGRCSFRVRGIGYRSAANRYETDLAGVQIAMHRTPRECCGLVTVPRIRSSVFAFSLCGVPVG